MNHRFHRTLGLTALITLTLGACVSVAPPSPMLTQATSNLQALRADPAVARWAPDDLAQAEKAVKAAQQAHGDPQHVKHLAFMAENQVEIAKASAIARREESAYKTLVAKRDALGGGNDSITTLSQDVIGTSSSQVAAVNREAAANNAAEPVAAPVAEAPVMPSTPTPSAPIPAPSPVIAAPTSSAQTANVTAPSAAPVPSSSSANGALLTLRASDFNRSNQLTSVAHNAVHALLASLVQQPSRQLVISGASRAQLEAVSKALAETGVPSWRLRTQLTSDRSVSIDFGGEVSTPSIKH